MSQARAQQQQSFAGRLGRLAQPVFAPLGYDWQLTVGVLTSFLAREVFELTYTPGALIWLAGVVGGAALVGVAGVLAARSVVTHPPVATLRV